MKFKKSFTQQEPISTSAIEKAIQVLESGRLHRYNTTEGELSEVDLLEQEFAAYLEVPYCLACASGGYALHIALKSLGVTDEDKVLCNSYTLAPVPGAITNAGANIVLVETSEDYLIDIDDLHRHAKTSQAKFFILSHMRGHIADMDKIMDICDENNIYLIEDCAHTMGATWKGVKSGSFGAIGCFSTQTYKHINSGEGGFLTTKDELVMAKAVLYSGSYMHYGKHAAAPSMETFDKIRTSTPNFSGRMDNLRASILRPQLAELDEKCDRWNRRYKILSKGLNSIDGVWLPQRPKEEVFIGSSIQFSLLNFDDDRIRQFLKESKEAGIVINWFGDAEPKNYTSRYDSWKYIDALPELPKTKKVLSTMCDMRIPLTFTEEDCGDICDMIAKLVARN